jgi:hypothetical protein
MAMLSILFAAQTSSTQQPSVSRLRPDN